jgi:hypothetical protein
MTPGNLPFVMKGSADQAAPSGETVPPPQPAKP